MAQEDIPIAKEGCPYGTRGQCTWHRKTFPLQRRAVPMAQEGSAHGTGRHPHCKGGLSLWHRRAVHMAQEDIPIAKEGCSYGSRGQCIWHRTVAMAQ